VAKKILTGVDNSNQRLINVASPSSGTDATNKTYVDNLIEGLSYKTAVRAATTANGDDATAFEDGDTVDGVTLATGDRLLRKDQTDASENGIFVVQASGAPVRAADANTAAELNRATVKVIEGSVNAGKQFTQATVDPVVDTDDLVWAESGGGQTYTADGEGIEVSSNEFSLELDGNTLQKSSSGLRIGSGAAGAGLVEASGVLAVGAGTGITVAADALAVDTSVVARKYSALVGNGSATSFNLTHGLGTQFLSVTITDATSGEVVEADVDLPPAGSTIDVSFAVAPTTNQYRVSAVG
jgi:hypothetical protein